MARPLRSEDARIASRGPSLHVKPGTRQKSARCLDIGETESDGTLTIDPDRAHECVSCATLVHGVPTIAAVASRVRWSAQIACSILARLESGDVRPIHAPNRQPRRKRLRRVAHRTVHRVHTALQRRADADDARPAALARWSLRARADEVGAWPSWAKDRKVGNSLINARAETVAEKSTFRSACAKRRCLVPVDGFYEWEQVRPEDGPRPKIPHFIHLKSDEPFVFAGLWEF